MCVRFFFFINCVIILIYVLFPTATEVLGKHVDHRNLFEQRMCCKRQSHFVYIGQGKMICLSLSLCVCPSVCIDIYIFYNLSSPLLPQTSPGVTSVWMLGCAGLTVGDQDPGRPTRHNSRNILNTPPCWNFFGANKYVKLRINATRGRQLLALI